MSLKDIDAEIAEKLFGWVWVCNRLREDDPTRRLAHPDYSRQMYEPATDDEPLALDWNLDTPPYSTILQSAWPLVDWIRLRDWDFSLSIPRNEQRVIVRASRRSDSLVLLNDAEADTVPLAICRLTLRVYTREQLFDPSGQH